jgi:hypothetical protein
MKIHHGSIPPLGFYEHYWAPSTFSFHFSWIYWSSAIFILIILKIFLILVPKQNCKSCEYTRYVFPAAVLDKLWIPKTIYLRLHNIDNFQNIKTKTRRIN